MYGTVLQFKRSLVIYDLQVTLFAYYGLELKLTTHKQSLLQVRTVRYIKIRTTINEDDDNNDNNTIYLVDNYSIGTTTTTYYIYL